MANTVTDPHALLDAYADEYGVTRGRLEVHAPRAFAAIRAVLDLHKPWHPEFGGPYCERCLIYPHIDVTQRVEWPCPTVQAIAAALEKR